MKTLCLAITAAALLASSPSIAQEHSDHHAVAAATAAKPMSEMTDAELHAHCKALMGHKMDGRVRHDHSAEKSHTAPPAPTPLSDAEMKAQHDKCAATMAEASAGLKAK
jgi:hypothetical protein